VSVLNQLSPVALAFVYALIPTVVAIIGTVVATFKQPGVTVRSALLHFAAGVIVAVVALDLLPKVTRARGDLLWVVIGFALGVLVMLGVRQLDQRDDNQNQGQQEENSAAQQEGTGGWPVGLIAGNVVDQVVGGIVLGVGVVEGQNLGALLSLSMTIEDLSFGLAIATLLGVVGATRWQMIWTTTWLGLVFVAVAVAGAVVLHLLPGSIITLLLAFGAAALLFVVLEQLIGEAHEAATAPPLAASLFAGFLLIMVLGMLS